MPFNEPIFTKLTIAQQRHEEHTQIDPKYEARTQIQVRQQVKNACHQANLEETLLDTLCKETLFNFMKMRHTTNHRQTEGLQSENKTFSTRIE